jgi:hypothetical protein
MEVHISRLCHLEIRKMLQMQKIKEHVSEILFTACISPEHVGLTECY